MGSSGSNPQRRSMVPHRLHPRRQVLRERDGRTDLVCLAL